MSIDLSIESSYLCQFDTNQGNTLIEYKAKSSVPLFSDLEYLSLPAGLHDLASAKDTVKFQVLDHNKQKYFSICRVYNNSKTILETDSSSVLTSGGIDRTKVKIYSLGIILPLKDESELENLVLYEDYITKQIDLGFKEFSIQQDANASITQLLEALSNNALLVQNDSWREPYQLLKAIDCLIFPLWKQLMLNKSILIINYDTPKISFDELNKLIEYLKNISATDKYVSVYNTVLSNFESVLNNNKTCYLAYTTDVILKEVTKSYDVVLELKKNNAISLTDKHGISLHATYVESLKLITQFKNDGNKFDKKSSSQQFIDFFYLLFTFNNIKPGYYKYIDSAVDIPLQAPLEKQRFEKWLVSLNSGIERLLKNEKNYNKNTKVLCLKPSDVLALGFDGFNESDLEFMKNYLKMEQFSHEISKTYFKSFDFSLFL